jgi:hypothetical protein
MSGHEGDDVSAHGVSGFSRPFAKRRLEILVGDIRRAAAASDPSLRAAGVKLATFVHEPGPETATELAAGLHEAARDLRIASEDLNRYAVEIDIHAVDEEADRRLAAAVLEHVATAS